MNKLTFNARCAVFVLSLAWSLDAGVLRAAEQQSLDTDHSTVYRIQPSVEGVAMIRVSPDEIKPGLAYNYFNERLGRRVWGFAREGGKFQYAFGEGTTLPTDLFDLRVTSEMQSEILERRAPGLEFQLSMTGQYPAVQLDSTGQWRLLQQTSVARVFDVETGHRWEWHGGRQVAVIHTTGDLWQIVDGRYRPVTIGLPIVPCGCGLTRAGSAAFVMHTGEPSI
jgi:hypothetical protein